METPNGMVSGPLDDEESVEVEGGVARTFGILKASMASMGSVGSGRSVGSARLSSTTTENS